MSQQAKASGRQLQRLVRPARVARLAAARQRGETPRLFSARPENGPDRLQAAAPRHAGPQEATEVAPGRHRARDWERLRRTTSHRTPQASSRGVRRQDAFGRSIGATAFSRRLPNYLVGGTPRRMRP